MAAKRVLKDTTSDSPTGIPSSTRIMVSSMFVMRKTKTQSRRGSLSNMYSEAHLLAADTLTSDRKQGSDVDGAFGKLHLYSFESVLFYSVPFPALVLLVKMN